MEQWNARKSTAHICQPALKWLPNIRKKTNNKRIARVYDRACTNRNGRRLFFQVKQHVVKRWQVGHEEKQRRETITNVKQEHIYISLAPRIKWTLLLFKFGNPKAVRKPGKCTQSEAASPRSACQNSRNTADYVKLIAHTGSRFAGADLADFASNGGKWGGGL